MKLLFPLVLFCWSMTAYGQSDSLLNELISEQRLEMDRISVDLDSMRISMETMQSANRTLTEQLAQIQRQLTDLKDQTAEAVLNAKAARSNANQGISQTRALSASMSKELATVQARVDSANKTIGIEAERMMDSLDVVNSALSQGEQRLRSESARLDGEIEEQSKSSSIGAVVFVVLLIALGLFLMYRLRSASAQTKDQMDERLSEAQRTMQEQLVEVDQKLVDALNQSPIPAGSEQEDHSLALKVADEVTKIESNLAQMDENVRGHRHLTKSVKNVKNNLRASGYEITEMLGKPYNEGMVVQADFILDESLGKDERVISRVKKPEVRFGGEVIQVGTITVSQG